MGAVGPEHCTMSPPNLGETGPLSQGVHAGGKAIRIHHINGTEVRKKRLRGHTISNKQKTDLV